MFRRIIIIYVRFSRRESIGTCSSVDESRHETLIMRYLSHGDLESATFWIDISYAEKSSKSSSLYEFAQYIKDRPFEPSTARANVC
ncbi:hypothetical protein KIN20_008119 [Parelaphostrongylus tenuis]|uniref:Uncharacterized protein n=1 Tax=Parelaphostrongylus tenuis TaxID=148309 RepID=A0AAD5QKF9_PARTN|nr:hypothetical protein KIN20_008119 [Parelaphostrongylus tenuis]